MPMRRRTLSISTPRAVIACAGQDDPPGLQRLQQVDTAQECGLARPGRADEADDLVLADDEVDATQDLQVAERLVDALDADGLTAQQATAGATFRRSRGLDLRSWIAHRAPAIWRRRSRSTSQSTVRDSGMVRTRKMTAVITTGV